jgi:hypothetical protein
MEDNVQKYRFLKLSVPYKGTPIPIWQYNNTCEDLPLSHINPKSIGDGECILDSYIKTEWRNPSKLFLRGRRDEEGWWGGESN